jgi:penicillin G amidase
MCARNVFLAWVTFCSLLPLRLAYAEAVEILRDPWGIPHVFSQTDAGAFYGLGYATAEDRAFQMTYSLRIVQGRLAEVVGDIKMLTRNDTSVDHDRKMRTFGFYRAARRTAANLDDDSGALLDAYCRGVNDWFAENMDNLPPLFAETGIAVEPWTPADCLVSWWHIGQFFATDGTRDLIASRNNRRGFPTPRDLTPMPADDGPAVVKRGDVNEVWLARVRQYANDHGLATDESGDDGPKFSHAWVVGGKKTTTGSAVLMSDPQTPVRNPSLFYEFHIKGRSFNARGIGVAGSPIILIGFTDRVAWGMTALGADQADLFLLDTDGAHPNQYRLDGAWKPMAVHHEVIKVKGSESIDYPIRETQFGPVATAFCYARPADGEVAIKRVPMCEADRETIQGALGMLRAENANDFDAALESWRFPTANVLYGDRAGNIGFRVLGAIPLRSTSDGSHGRQAVKAHSASDDWREMLPHNVKPAVMNPASGFLYSANHRPIESWYPIPIGAMTGTGGDTVRSWRLRELLETKEMYTPEDVREIHHDMVNPARRDIVRLALHIRETQPDNLSDDAMRALDVLGPWLDAGASMSLDKPGSALALELNTFFRFVSTELAFQYGGGESGLVYFLKMATGRLAETPDVKLNRRECNFIDASLASAWQTCVEKYGPEPATWQQRARDGVAKRRLGYYESLDNFPALKRQLSLNLPPLVDVDGGTIACQTAQSYTQWVPLHDPDLAQSVLPIGESECPGAKSRMSTWRLWSEGQLHSSPLSRDKVEALGVTTQTLEFD